MSLTVRLTVPVSAACPIDRGIPTDRQRRYKVVRDQYARFIAPNEGKNYLNGSANLSLLAMKKRQKNEVGVQSSEGCRTRDSCRVVVR